MNFEINEGSEHLPDEEDIYGANEVEERERFDALFGKKSAVESRMLRRRYALRLTAVLGLIGVLLIIVLRLI